MIEGVVALLQKLKGHDFVSGVEIPWVTGIGNNLDALHAEIGSLLTNQVIQLNEIFQLGALNLHPSGVNHKCFTAIRTRRRNIHIYLSGSGDVIQASHHLRGTVGLIRFKLILERLQPLLKDGALIKSDLLQLQLVPRANENILMLSKSFHQAESPKEDANPDDEHQEKAFAVTDCTEEKSDHGSLW